MNSGDIPLISRAILQASLSARQAGSAEAASSTVDGAADARVFSARVTASQPAPAPQSTSQSPSQNPQWLLSLTASGKTLQVLSEHPAATGTLMTLKLSGSPGRPQLTVIPPQPPAGSAVNLPKVQSDSLAQAVRSLLAARLAWLPVATDAATPGGPTMPQGHGPATIATTDLYTAGTQRPGMPGAENPAARSPQGQAQVPATSQTQGDGLPASERHLLQTLHHRQAQLPPVVQKSLQQFLLQLPESKQLATPNGLHQAILNAPVRFERNLFYPSAPAQSLNATSVPASGPSTDGKQGDRSNSVAQIFRQLWHPQSTASQAQTTAGQSGVSLTLKERIAALTNIPSGNIPSTRSQPGAVTGVATDSLLAGSSATAFSAPPDAVTSNLKGLILHALQRWTAAKEAPTQAPVTSTVTGAAPATATLQDSPAEIFRLLQQVAAQTEQEQVRLLQAGDPQPTYLPLLWRQGEQIHQAQLGIQQGGSEADKVGGKRRRWQLTLHFDLERLGPLDIELDLCPPAVSATFWSEQSSTLANLNQAIQPLRHSLQALGADVGDLQARHGRRPPQAASVIRQSLVDIHT